MKLCIPVALNKGLESVVYGHFGSAPLFMIVDTETLQCEPLQNKDQHHEHGMCRPLDAIDGKSVDGILVGGIGLGALNKLLAGGVKVYKAPMVNISAAVEAFNAGELPLFTPQHTCAGHGHGGGCGH